MGRRRWCAEGSLCDKRGCSVATRGTVRTAFSFATSAGGRFPAASPSSAAAAGASFTPAFSFCEHQGARARQGHPAHDTHPRAPGQREPALTNDFSFVAAFVTVTAVFLRSVTCGVHTRAVGSSGSATPRAQELAPASAHARRRAARRARRGEEAEGACLIHCAGAQAREQARGEPEGRAWRVARLDLDVGQRVVHLVDGRVFHHDGSASASPFAPLVRALNFVSVSRASHPACVFCVFWCPRVRLVRSTSNRTQDTLVNWVMNTGYATVYHVFIYPVAVPEHVQITISYR